MQIVYTRLLKLYITGIGDKFAVVVSITWLHLIFHNYLCAKFLCTKIKLVNSVFVNINKNLFSKLKLAKHYKQIKSNEFTINKSIFSEYNSDYSTKARFYDIFMIFRIPLPRKRTYYSVFVYCRMHVSTVFLMNLLVNRGC